MNGVVLSGRLTKDPEIRYTAGEDPKAVARYTLAVDKRMRKGSEENTADFIPCVAWGKNAEITEKYLKKGMKIFIHGHLSTGSYVNKNGVTVYTMDVVVEKQEFDSYAGDQRRRDAQRAMMERDYTQEQWDDMERDLVENNFETIEDEEFSDILFLNEQAVSSEENMIKPGMYPDEEMKKMGFTMGEIMASHLGLWFRKTQDGPEKYSPELPPEPEKCEGLYSKSTIRWIEAQRENEDMPEYGKLLEYLEQHDLMKLLTYHSWEMERRCRERDKEDLLELDYGTFGNMRLKYLVDWNEEAFDEYLLEGKLKNHLIHTQEAAKEKMNWMTEQMAERNGVTEELKQQDPLKWTQEMNGFKMSALEFVRNDLIYS